MSDARTKADKTEPLMAGRAVRPQVPPPLAPRLPPALAKVAASERPGSSLHKFDKAFAVFVSSARGIANGVGRNISAEGMFVETRDPCPIGTEVSIIFGSDAVGAEITAVGEVRFPCYLNFTGTDGDQEGVRGIGIRFQRFEEGPSAGPRTAVPH